jgi:hypothetical protein
MLFYFTVPRLDGILSIDDMTGVGTFRGFFLIIFLILSNENLPIEIVNVFTIFIIGSVLHDCFRGQVLG